jgi:hypothetical protein
MDSDLGEDWYLREWAVHFGKRQIDLVHEAGWDRQRANLVWNSKQPYRRDTVNEVARWLGLRPFELLMPPEEAMALRRLRDTARLIAAEEEGRDFQHHPDAKPAVAQSPRGPKLPGK